MAKNISKLQQDDEDYNFSDMLESSFEDEIATDMLSNIVEGSNNQMRLAFDLTKLIVEKSTTTMNADDIFMLYKKASKCVAENLPWKELWEDLH